MIPKTNLELSIEAVHVGQSKNDRDPTGPVDLFVYGICVGEFYSQNHAFSVAQEIRRRILDMLDEVRPESGIRQRGKSGAA